MPDAVTDAFGRRIPVAPCPRRIISLVPSVTECPFDLGAGARVVGRTDFCVRPADEVGPISTGGGPKSIDPGLVAELYPDLVLANQKENDRHQIEALIASGMRMPLAFPRSLSEVPSPV